MTYWDGVYDSEQFANDVYRECGSILETELLTAEKLCLPDYSNDAWVAILMDYRKKCEDLLAELTDELKEQHASIGGRIDLYDLANIKTQIKSIDLILCCRDC